VEISDEVVVKQVANRHVPVQEVAPPLICYLGLDLLFEVVEVGLADRLPRISRAAGVSASASSWLTRGFPIVRFEGHQALARSDSTNFSTLVERT
jgi:hypothetical protein